VKCVEFNTNFLIVYLNLPYISVPENTNTPLKLSFFILPHENSACFLLLLTAPIPPREIRLAKTSEHASRIRMPYYSGRFYEIPSARKSVGKGHYLTYNPDPIMYVVFTSLRLIIVSTTGVQRPFVAANHTIYSSF